MALPDQGRGSVSTQPEQPQTEPPPPEVVPCLLGCLGGGVASLVALVVVAWAKSGRPAGSGASEDLRSWVPLIPVGVATALVSAVISRRHPLFAGIVPLLWFCGTFFVLARGIGQLGPDRLYSVATGLTLCMLLPGLAVLLLAELVPALRKR